MRSDLAEVSSVLEEYLKDEQGVSVCSQRVRLKRDDPLRREFAGGLLADIRCR
jgi:hypothetical protein